MWNLDDPHSYKLFLHLKVPFAATWGGDDRYQRELIREAASRVFPAERPTLSIWAFRIFVRRSRSFDVDNAPKLVVDAFCLRQIRRDDSRYPTVALYDDDSVQHVNMVQVAGELARDGDLTNIDIFWHNPDTPR